MLGYFHSHWYVTTRCNSRCQTCSIWKDPAYKSSESPLEERFHLLSQIKRMGFQSVDFTGGEPLLYRGLPALIAYGRRLGLFTSLTTNGTLYPKFARDLKGNLASLSFSLDAADRETHDTIRGIKCFDKVLQSMILARKLGEIVLLKTTVCNDYIDAIPPLIHLAQKYGVLVELNPEFAYFGNAPLSEENLHKLFRWWRHPNVIISHAHLHFMLAGGNDIRKPKCPVGTGVVTIAPDNSLYFPCMHMVRTQIPLRDLDLRKTLESPEARAQIAKVGRFPFCHQCTIPCYFETAYYTQVDPYWVRCIASRIGYLRKRATLALRTRFG